MPSLRYPGRGFFSRQPRPPSPSPHRRMRRTPVGRWRCDVLSSADIPAWGALRESAYVWPGTGPPSPFNGGVLDMTGGYPIRPGPSSSASGVYKAGTSDPKSQGRNRNSARAGRPPGPAAQSASDREIGGFRWWTPGPSGPSHLCSTTPSCPRVSPPVVGAAERPTCRLRWKSGNPHRIAAAPHDGWRTMECMVPNL